MLNTETLFSEQVFNWFETLGFQCKFAERQAGSFEIIEVVRSDKTLIQLTLIGLTDWLGNGSEDSMKLNFEKVKMQRTSGLKSLILWEDYWIAKSEIVKSRLSAMLGISQKIPARLTPVRRIDKETARQFLDINHLNGSVSSKTKFGLFLPKRYFRILNSDFRFDPHSEEFIVAVATFSHPRVFERNGKPFRSFELIRFGSLMHTNVVGGLDKLINAFESDRKPDDIMTYADLDWSDGANYGKLGFEKISETPFMAFDLNLKTMTRFSAPEDKSSMPGLETGENQSIRIFNSGSVKYVKTIGR